MAAKPLQLLLLVTLGFKVCRFALPDRVLTIALSEILKVNITTCDDLANVFGVKNDSTKLNEVNQTDKVFQSTSLTQYDSNKSEENSLLLTELFGTDTKAVSLGVRMLDKLANIKTTKLNQAVLHLQKQKQFHSKYYLINVFDVIYNREHSFQRRKQVEDLLRMKLLDLNLQSGKEQVDYRYFERLTGKELRSHAKSFVCVFSVLANLMNNHALAELLQPFEAVLENPNSSTAMLVFLNSLLTKAMEGPDCVECIYQTLFMRYIIQKLKSFNKPDSRETLLKAAEWSSRMQEKFVENNISQFFVIMDETFPQAAYSGRRLLSPRAELVKEIERKMTEPSPLTTRLRKLIADMKKKLQEENTSKEMVEFIQECVVQIRKSNKVVMTSPLYNYITKKINTVASVDKDFVHSFRDKQVEQIAAILDEYLTQEPYSASTFALDWIFDFKLQMLTKHRDTSIFDVLENTFDYALQRRQERLKVKRATKQTRINPKLFSKIQLSKEEERRIRVAMGSS